MLFWLPNVSLLRNLTVNDWFSVADVLISCGFVNRISLIDRRAIHETTRTKLDSPLASCDLVDRPYCEIEKILESTRRLSFITLESGHQALCLHPLRGL